MAANNFTRLHSTYIARRGEISLLDSPQLNSYEELRTFQRASVTNCIVVYNAVQLINQRWCQARGSPGQNRPISATPPPNNGYLHGTEQVRTL